MCSINDLENEYKKEIEVHRSHQVIIKALMAIKQTGQFSSALHSKINRIYLTNDLKMKPEEVASVFGSETSEPISAIERAKLTKMLNAQIQAQCDEVINFTREKKLEENFNVFEIENVKTQIEDSLTEYNEKLKQLVNFKEQVAELESIAVDLKVSPAQRRQAEIDNLASQLGSLEIEYFRQFGASKICNQVPGNAEALLKLKNIIDDES